MKRLLSLTAIVAAALLCAWAVHLVRSAPLGRKRAESERALAIDAALRARVAVLQASDGVERTLAQGALTAALARLPGGRAEEVQVLLLNAEGCLRSAPDRSGSVRPDATRAGAAAAPSGAAPSGAPPSGPAQADGAMQFRACVVGTQLRSAVFVPLGAVRMSATRRVPVVDVLSEPLPEPHADDWLLARGDESVVSLRLLERQLIDTWIAALSTPELCPVGLRLADRLPLGAAIDAALAASAGEVDSAALSPLCRRERQRQLAHENLLRMGRSFPFTPGVLLDEVERSTLTRLQDREASPGLGAKARSLMRAMLEADEDLRKHKDVLRAAAAPLLAALAYEAALSTLSGAGAPEAAPRASAARAVDASPMFACTAALTPDPVAYRARLFARFAGEMWPAPPLRDALLHFLYAHSGKDMPAEAAASGAALFSLWQTPTLGLACARQLTPFSAAVDAATRAAMARIALE